MQVIETYLRASTYIVDFCAGCSLVRPHAFVRRITVQCTLTTIPSHPGETNIDASHLNVFLARTPFFLPSTPPCATDIQPFSGRTPVIVGIIHVIYLVAAIGFTPILLLR